MGANHNGTSPWFESSHGYPNKPSTILLPSGIIKIPTTWIMPSGTSLVGQETTDPLLNSGGATLQTTIQATTSPVFVGAMIQFGDSDAVHCPSSSACSDISVEYLTLDGNNQSITGILNQNSQDATRIDHVTLYRVLGTGLSVGANPNGGDAHNSGPYSNINYDTGASGVFGSVCASIKGLSNTRGIHGLTCDRSRYSSISVHKWVNTQETVMQLCKAVDDLLLLFAAKFPMPPVPPSEPFLDKPRNILRWRRQVPCRLMR